MTIEEAIERLSNRYLVVGMNPNPDEDILDNDSLDMAISALRAQQEAEKNEPLTLEELLSMVGKPAYMVFSEKDKGQWYLIASISGEKIKFCDFDANTYYCYKNDYGPEWLAYRRPPKEARNV